MKTPMTTYKPSNEPVKLESLQDVTRQMLVIEQKNIAYNQATNNGQNPNGQESEIETMLAEWDTLKAKRNKLKYA